jgi:Ca2+-binding EF-hand superfamily protein
MKKFLIVGTAALAVLAAPVLAGPGDRDGPGRADTNGDGKVTRAEADAAAQSRFVRMDANADGKLDRSDREAQGTKMRDEHFGKLDADGNGSISKAEWDAGAAKRMERRGDRAERGGRSGREGRKSGRGNMMMKRADTNGDKAISREEFQAAEIAMFTRADANKDGAVTAAERDAVRAKMREHRGARRGMQGDMPPPPPGEE